MKVTVQSWYVLAMSQATIAASLAQHITDSLKNLIDDDLLAGDIDARIGYDTQLEESMSGGIDDLAALKVAVFRDPRTQRVLLDIIDSAVDAAVYERY